MTGSQTLEELRGRVDTYLRESFPGVSVDDEGDFMFPFESVITWVRPTHWEGGRTLVRVWAITNIGMRVDGELTRFLLTSNAKLGLGGFRLDESTPAVLLVHTLLGDYLDRAELAAAVGSVTGAADQLAREIKARFGGTLFTES